MVDVFVLCELTVEKDGTEFVKRMRLFLVFYSVKNVSS